jgi:AcrR family transcriptional regulator
MPPDGTDTRARLLDEAERVFAERGVHQATTREITEAAGQRNVSALTYHFGSRHQLLYEILVRQGDPLDVQRGELLDPAFEDRDSRTLIGALVVPYAGCLGTRRGRNYVRIVAQLTDQFPIWRVPDGTRPPNLRRILAILEARVSAPPAVARERIVATIMLMTTAIAERARMIEHGDMLELDHTTFVDNLADTLVGVLHAPVGPSLYVPR